MLTELISALAGNGFARNPDATLNSVFSNTLQDGQYSIGARQSALTLAKYTERYGKMTMKEIRHLASLE